MIEKLKEGNREALAEVYDAYRRSFIDFMQRYALSEAEVEDIYQDSILALHENAMKGKLDGLQSSLKTYLFAIGKYMAYKRLKLNQKSNGLMLVLPEDVAWEEPSDHYSKEQLRQLADYIGQLGEQCQAIIKLCYYEARSTEDMVQMLGYNNKDTLKSQKTRCLKHLKKLFNVSMKSNGR